MRALSHGLAILLACAVCLGVPFVAFADKGALAAAVTGSGVDLVSSATAIQDAPSGTYTIFINADKHPDKDVLAEWEAFFAGEDVPLIMEDVSCTALAGDAAGIEMAESLRSRLPENQMKLSIEQGALALSKAERGVFDVLVMSDGAKAAYGADSLVGEPFVRVVIR